MKYMNAVKKYGFSAVLLVPGISFAAIPTADLSSAVTGIQSDANAVFAAVFPVIALVLGLIIGIKLFKRFVKSV